MPQREGEKWDSETEILFLRLTGPESTSKIRWEPEVIDPKDPLKPPLLYTVFLKVNIVGGAIGALEPVVESSTDDRATVFTCVEGANPERCNQLCPANRWITHSITNPSARSFA
jgi:hypothetical protein